LVSLLMVRSVNNVPIEVIFLSIGFPMSHIILSYNHFSLRIIIIVSLILSSLSLLRIRSVNDISFEIMLFITIPIRLIILPSNWVSLSVIVVLSFCSFFHLNLSKVVKCAGNDLLLSVELYFSLFVIDFFKHFFLCVLLAETMLI
jgi:hypothetical protein